MIASDCVIAWGEVNIILSAHERECKGYISFNRGVNEFNRGVNDLNRGVNGSVARQGCNLLRAAVTSAVTSQGCCCGNLQIHPLDLGQVAEEFYWTGIHQDVKYLCKHCDMCQRTNHLLQPFAPYTCD